MFIQTEATPDPAAVRFLPGRSVTGSGTAEFTDAAAAAGSPLAARLFGIEGVTAVELGPDYIVVGAGQGADWGGLKPVVLRAIMEHFIAGEPVMLPAGDGGDSVAPIEDDADSALAAQVRELIETRIHPAVAQNGGDIVYRGFSGGKVLVDLIGPAIALRPAIENMLHHYVPEVDGVLPYEEYERLQKPEMNTPEALTVRRILDEDINPSVAGHGGYISLIDVQKETVYIRLEGGCQGCGMADVTLKQGVEVAIRNAVPSITAVLDVTDHDGGNNPYYTPGKGGASAI